MKTRLAVASFVLALAAAVFVVICPVYSSGATLLQINGSGAVVPVMFPVAVAMLPVLFRKQAVRIVAAILMGAFALIAGMSIGLFYAPAAILMLLAACVSDDAKLREAFP
jgi:hypothetical protein